MVIMIIVVIMVMVIVVIVVIMVILEQLSRAAGAGSAWPLLDATHAPVVLAVPKLFQFNARFHFGED